MNYLITGATGGFGNYAMEYLKQLVPQENIYVLARNEEKGKTLEEKGWNVRFGDYADYSSMKKPYRELIACCLCLVHLVIGKLSMKML